MGKLWPKSLSSPIQDSSGFVRGDGEQVCGSAGGAPFNWRTLELVGHLLIGGPWSLAIYGKRAAAPISLDNGPFASERLPVLGGGER